MDPRLRFLRSLSRGQAGRDKLKTPGGEISTVAQNFGCYFSGCFCETSFTSFVMV